MRTRWCAMLSLCSWVLLGLAVAVVGAAVLVPRLTGSTPMTVLTGSMAPTYPPGALVVVRPVPAEDISIGTPITYQLRSGEPTVVTHRVIGVGYDGEGERIFTTQGDANEAPDREQVRAVQVRGEVWYAVPWIGRLNLLFTRDQHELITRVVAGGCFVYAAGLMVRSWRRRPEPAPASAHRAAS
ncbi:MAG: signal peptidase I [Nocardioides marinisabuli]|uniref:signal peptidase I n=1 Tax=Nocardioides marinisabuli TaxID=419476 RepID=UPI00321AA332